MRSMVFSVFTEVWVWSPSLINPGTHYVVAGKAIITFYSTKLIIAL